MKPQTVERQRFMKEPQIGIEPMTARCGSCATSALPSVPEDAPEGNGSQEAPEARPNLRENGNEVAMEIREALAQALMAITREYAWDFDTGLSYDVWADADLAAELSDRCDRLIQKEERLKLRIAALKQRTRKLAVRVDDEEMRRNPFILCSDGLPPMYVYALVSTKAPQTYRYIGCTDSPHQRFSAHLSDNAATRVREWVKETLRDGHLVQMVELWRGSDRLEAEAQEQRMIADYVALGMADLNVHGNTAAYAGHRRALNRRAAA